MSVFPLLDMPLQMPLPVIEIVCLRAVILVWLHFSYFIRRNQTATSLDGLIM